jgi:hypothetical protein
MEVIVDFITLANQVIIALTPFLHFLSSAGASVGTSIVTKLGEDIYDKGKEQGKRLYQAVKVRIEEEKAVDNGKANKALQNFLEDPDDYADVFRKKLALLLQTDPSFARALDQMLQQSVALRQVILLGENAIAEGNEQSNTLGFGEQRMQLEKGAKAVNNKQNISKSF